MRTCNITDGDGFARQTIPKSRRREEAKQEVCGRDEKGVICALRMEVRNPERETFRKRGCQRQRERAREREKEREREKDRHPENKREVKKLQRI